MFSSFGYTEIILIGIIALLLYGERLPEVARSFGRTYRQLRNKVDEFQREFREWERIESPPPQRPLIEEQEERFEPSTPKFKPPADD